VRSFVFVVGLLSAVAAAAQNIGNEIVSDPLQPNLAPLNLAVSAVSLAPTANASSSTRRSRT
jgi:hypothetical protein